MILIAACHLLPLLPACLFTPRWYTPLSLLSAYAERHATYAAMMLFLPLLIITPARCRFARLRYADRCCFIVYYFDAAVMLFTCRCFSMRQKSRDAYADTPCYTPCRYVMHFDFAIADAFAIILMVCAFFVTARRYAATRRLPCAMMLRYEAGQAEIW